MSEIDPMDRWMAVQMRQNDIVFFIGMAACVLALVALGLLSNERASRTALEARVAALEASK